MEVRYCASCNHPCTGETVQDAKQALFEHKNTCLAYADMVDAMVMEDLERENRFFARASKNHTVNPFTGN